MFLLAALLASVMQGKAQSEVGAWTVTPRIGVNMAQLTDPDIYIDTNQKMKYGNKMGLVAGVEAEYQLNNFLGLSAAALYSGQGSRMKDNNQFRDWRVSLHYLNVPLMAQVYLMPGAAIRVGAQFEFMLNSHVSGERFDKQWEHVSTDDSGYGAFDFSIPFGFRYIVGDFQLDATYSLGLTNTTKYSATKVRNHVVQLTLGYRFEL